MPTPASLCIVHPWDPWNQAIGGFDTCLDGVLRCAPRSWSLELIGFSADPEARPVGRWLELEFAGRPVRFLAAMTNRLPNEVRRLPLSLTFAAICRARGLSTAAPIVQFHRFESALAVRLRGEQHQVHFLHNHPLEETRSAYSDVRWRHFPQVHHSLLLNRLRRASLVVAVDPRTPTWLEGALPNLDGHVVLQPQWADPAIFYPASPLERSRNAAGLRTRMGFKDRSRIFLFAGRLETQKDPLLLLRAFAKVAQEAYLLVVGHGRLSGAVGALARELGIEDRVYRIGPRSRSELADLYRACDVAVCSSAYESGPRLVFEALACGMPIVSFDVGQVRSVLERDHSVGVLVEERTPAAFAAGLEEMLSRSRSPDLWLRCAAAVRGRTPESCLAEVMARYQSWLDGSVA